MPIDRGVSSTISGVLGAAIALSAVQGPKDIQGMFPVDPETKEVPMLLEVGRDVGIESADMETALEAIRKSPQAVQERLLFLLESLNMEPSDLQVDLSDENTFRFLVSIKSIADLVSLLFNMKAKLFASLKDTEETEVWKASSELLTAMGYRFNYNCAGPRFDFKAQVDAAVIGENYGIAINKVMGNG